MVGLDVSASSIKLVELDRGEDGELILVRCAIEPLEPGWITDGNIEQFDDVAEALRRLLKKSGTQAKSAALALPASQVISKKVVLPGALTDQELEVQAEAEASQYIPFPLDEVYLDFCVMGPNATIPEDVDVLLVAARREKVQDVQGLAEAAGLKPEVVDVASYAARLAAGRLIERLPGAAETGLVALFDVGSLGTSMQVVQHDEVLYERDLSFGGTQLTQLLAQRYGWSPEEAEQKKRLGELPDDSEAQVLRPFMDTLGEEIARGLQFFFSSSSHNQVDHVLLAGGAVAMPGLSEVVAQQTGTPCSVLNPFEGMRISEGVRQQKLQREAPSYLTACGLALRRFWR